MNGETAVEQEGDGALPLDGTEAKYTVWVVEGCCHGNSNHKMSLL